MERAKRTDPKVPKEASPISPFCWVLLSKHAYNFVLEKMTCQRQKSYTKLFNYACQVGQRVYQFAIFTFGPFPSTFLDFYNMFCHWEANYPWSQFLASLNHGLSWVLSGFFSFAGLVAKMGSKVLTFEGGSCNSLFFLFFFFFF